MKKYCKIVNNETKQVNVGLGENVEFYKSIGYIEQEVEQDYKGNWYLKGYGEIESLEEAKEKKLKELKKDVENYIYSIYPLYKQNNIAIFGTDEERQKFKEFHNTTTSWYNEVVDKVKSCKSVKSLEKIGGVNINNEICTEQ